MSAEPPGSTQVAARPAPRGPDKQPAKIAGMFDSIAHRYDLLNHLLSGGLDLYWRARAIRALRFTGRELVLDLCTGTADLAIAARSPAVARSRFGEGIPRAGAARRVLGLDFSMEMLRIGQRKLRQRGLATDVPLVQGDAMRLPVASSSVDAVTIAFGIRNVLDPAAACAEIARVLKPGGRLAVLEFSLPTVPIVRPLYAWYFRNVLPRVGRLLSRHDDAYTYLPASVGAFLSPEEFTAMVGVAGLNEVTAVPLTFGVVYLYTATRVG
jgi:demethylmenaquinone methyltransferase/2-methoxy-6-polyprenyl-1,4-benzoquinol methylase